MLRMAEEASLTGAATLEALQAQGETLRHIRDEQQRIDDNLATSHRLLRGLESWRGAARNAIASWWDGGGQEVGHNSAAGDTTRVEGSGGDLGVGCAGSCANPFGATAAHGPNARPSMRSLTSCASSAVAGDGALSELSGIVSGLCAQANAMNAEIQVQTATLDAAVTSADSHQMAMNRNVARTKKLSGSSSWW